MSNINTTTKATINKIQDYIIEVDYNNEADIELDDTKEVHQAFLKLSHHKPFTILMEGRGKFVNFSDEAKRFYAKDEALIPYKIAMAIVIDSLPARIIAKFYSSFNKPIYKTKIFSNKEIAIKWLKKVYSESTQTNKETTI